MVFVCFFILLILETIFKAGKVVTIIQIWKWMHVEYFIYVTNEEIIEVLQPI